MHHNHTDGDDGGDGASMEGRKEWISFQHFPHRPTNKAFELFTNLTIFFRWNNFNLANFPFLLFLFAGTEYTKF